MELTGTNKPITYITTNVYMVMVLRNIALASTRRSSDNKPRWFVCSGLLR